MTGVMIQRNSLWLVLAAGVGLSGCGGGDVEDQTATVQTGTTMAFADVTEAEWEALANRRIFFGHQSVGRNILAGVRTILAENPQIRLDLVNEDDPAAVEGPALIEANIGRNGAPETKADAFADALEGGFGNERGAVAMYKYCYVDVVPATDPDALFEDYVRRTERLKERHPDLTLVHITLPLRVAETGPKAWLKTVLGRSTGTELNRKRVRFNDRLRERYAGDDPIFDLAYLQSIRRDGSRATSPYRGSRIPMLAPEWSNDGGHLNEAGQRRIAEQFLTFLATIPRTSAPAQVANRVDATGG